MLLGCCLLLACASEESELREEARAFVEANNSCERSGDCQNVHTECFPRAVHEGCCTVYLRYDYDREWFEDLEARIAEAGAGPNDGSCGGCCLAFPPVPACVDGKCTARME